MIVVMLMGQLGLVGTARHRVVMVMVMMMIVIVMSASGDSGGGVLVIGIVPKRVNLSLLMLLG